MTWCILIGTLAAFGAVCAMWVIAGWLLPSDSGESMIYLPGADEALIRRFLWFRKTGLLACRLVIVVPANGEEDRWSAMGIEICTPEELSSGLRSGAKNIDAGIGDHPGCDQHRGIPEL